MDMLVKSMVAGQLVAGSMGWFGAGGGHDTTNLGDEEADRQPLLIESSLHPAKRSSLLEI
ncbi:hypothetical protein PGT21_008799 [Puccinia graminis f. sp. tritici]|uniref:Uncharacterized protein n=1 Tax=Puccinia graminis f. sp. tritici TaxID=56615 RepID=A0A5B0QI93_PUCGR|nr:hypothetical protein PGT21_008799 [Puccinia graminis f. sp. tritici]